MATRAKKRQRAHRHKPDLEQEEDYLLHMDPSLMTERQQLAFLLRTTAHEVSDASHSGDESSEDEMSLHPTKKPRRIVRAVRVEHPTTATTPTRRGPGRPLKNKKSPRAADGKLRVMMQKSKGQHDKRLETKPSPSGSDDIAHLDTARTFGQRMPRCALCCDYDTVYEASFSDALFLCPTCDHKYPTQHALGRRACMT